MPLSSFDRGKITRALTELKPPLFQYKKSAIQRHAAVLCPLCIWRQKESILFIVRSHQLSRHSSEIGFPGGMQDKGETLEQCVRREVMEEIGLSKIDLYGQANAYPDKTGSILVTPFVGFIGEVEPQELVCSPEEVSLAFCIPVEELLSKQTHEMVSLRGTRIMTPNWKVPLEIHQKLAQAEAHTTIWGLTALLLYDLFRQIHVLE